ncbi:hypothetical protein scyTo_0026898, partial [Scyliorhinus torazame]|nr:hypothetical protein [Scyliorhinus torazame]
DKVRSVFAQLRETELLLVYGYFVPELVNAVLLNTDRVISDLKEKGVFTEREAEVRDTGEGLSLETEADPGFGDLQAF